MLANNNLTAATDALIVRRVRRNPVSALRARSGARSGRAVANRVLSGIAASFVFLATGGLAVADFNDNPKVTSFIDEMHERHQFEKDWLVTLFADTPRSEKACLLYTSPSPRDKRQSRMPSSA